jgi:hypothetical protein
VSAPLGPVEIGAREIYDAVMKLQGTVERLADRQDTAQREADDRHRELKTRQDDHEDRVRQIERRMWPLPTLSAAIALLALVLTVLPILTGTSPRR